MVDIGKDFLSISSIARANTMADQASALSKTKTQPGVKTDKSAEAGQSKEIDKAARDFEALLLHQMLKSMWESVPAGGLFGGSNEADMYRDMFNEALADSVSEGQGVGVREMVAKDLKRLEGYKGK